MKWQSRLKMYRSHLRCNACGHLWEKGGRAFYSRPVATPFVKINGNIQACRNCGTSAGLKILSTYEGDFTMGDLVNGVDTSHHNGVVDWARRYTRGDRFALLKATEGEDYVDPQYARSSMNAPKAGLITGAYCFFHPNHDPVSQAMHLMRVAGKVASGQLPHTLDWETLDGVGGKTNVAHAHQWIDVIEKETGITPFIYGSPGYLENLPLASLQGLERCPLWIAHYGVTRPRIPKPWTTFAIWQTSDNQGIDMDVFNGTIDDLKALTKK